MTNSTVGGYHKNAILKRRSSLKYQFDLIFC
jgi:hypothetical protein